MNEILMADKEPLIKNPIFLNGVSRTGKLFLGKIVAGLEGIEHFQSAIVLEHVPYIVRMGRMSEDAAIALLRVNVDESTYNMGIGRNLNLRFDDASSLFNSPELNEYLRRALTPLNEELVGRITRGDQPPVFILHSSLPNIGILFKAFPAMKWINLVRHPIDVIHSWYLRGWGKRLMSDPLSFVPVIAGVSSPVPWYASGWMKEYEALSEMDRIVKSIAVLTELGEETYNTQLTNEQQKRILFVAYEDVVENTMDVIKKMGVFLGTQPSKGMPSILAKEKCPGKLAPEKRNKKLQDIQEHASNEMYDLAMNLTSKYEEGITYS